MSNHMMIGYRCTILGPYMMDLGGRGHDAYTGSTGRIVATCKDGELVVRMPNGDDMYFSRSRVQLVVE